jgi:hypothetical protein
MFVKKSGGSTFTGGPVSSTVTSSVASGSNAFLASVAGARWHLGPGTNDYFTSDGANTINTPGFMSAGSGFSGPSYDAAGVSNISMASKVNDGAAAIGLVLNTVNTLANATAKLASLKNNSTEKLAFDKAGKPVYPTGAADAVVGTATLVGGTVTVSTTSVTASSKIFLSRNTAGGTVGDLRQGTIVAGTSFVINSASGTDTSTVNWWIVN